MAHLMYIYLICFLFVPQTRRTYNHVKSLHNYDILPCTLTLTTFCHALSPANCHVHEYRARAPFISCASSGIPSTPYSYCSFSGYLKGVQVENNRWSCFRAVPNCRARLGAIAPNFTFEIPDQLQILGWSHVALLWSWSGIEILPHGHGCPLS